MKTCITAGLAFTPLERVQQPVAVIEDGRIEAFGTREAVSTDGCERFLHFPDGVLAPGFIDIHVHGGAGHDVMNDDPAANAGFERHLAKHGVTSYCPTTVTASIDRTLTSLKMLGATIWASSPNEARARPMGVHLEGPFISKTKCGVHPVTEIQTPSVDLFRRFIEASGEAVRMMTLAPELPGAAELIREAVLQRVRVSLGHSDSGTTASKAGIAAGASHATHTFNAMRALDHRRPGILGVTLSDDRISADVIADGIHVAPDTLKVFLKAKGEERAVLITDGISATGMPDGKYKLGTLDVEVAKGQCLYKGRLAGSILTLDLAIRNVMSMAEWKMQQAVRLATLNPARVIGVEGRKGSLAAGMDADIVVLSPDGHVVETFVGGIQTSA
ncbi:MAG: N-acetylglucosamine-6-phosphate deacetylase [Acidobacteriales bacterium]|nr:N-acetylglucosamine-6-phosphate deacetylase [Terriglobales bacterium]